MKTLDLFSIGEMVIDFIPGREPDSFVRNAGGAPANVAIAMAKSGLHTGCLCCLGEDDFGRFLQDTLRDHGVEVLREELCREAVTTMAFVSLKEDGDRSFTFARKPGADMFLAPEDVREEDINRSVIVHAGSCSLSASPEDLATQKALRLGHEGGKLVSFDVNYRSLMWGGEETACTRAVEGILPYVDILKISEEEVGMLGGEDRLFSLMEKYSLTLIIETLGSRGAKCYLGGEVMEIPGRPARAVDATGAGDAFWGGFLSSLRIQGIEGANQLDAAVVQRAMAYGNTAGWICVQSKGAISSLPTREEIERNL